MQNDSILPYSLFFSSLTDFLQQFYFDFFLTGFDPCACDYPFATTLFIVSTFYFVV